MFKTFEFKKGISLVETLIYISIFSIFILSVTTFMSSLSSSRLHNQIVLEVNDQGARVMKTITQTLRNASQVNSPTIGNTALNLNLVTYTSIKNPTIFSENNGVIYMKEGSGAEIALTNNKVIASDLIFSNLSRPSTPNIIKISFKLSSISTTTSPGGAYSFTFFGSGGLRK
jgi:Tfp pilus assembly protein PilW